MVRLSGLQPEYQDEIRKLLTRQLLDAGPIPEPQAIARSLWSELRRLEADGAEWAGPVLDAAGPAGLRLFVTQTLKEDTASVRVFNNGWVEIPARYAVRPRDPETGEYVGGFQLPMWTELAWPQFLEMLASLAAQRDLLGHRIAALNEVAKLREQFPASKTPGEACAMAGIDPQHFELDEEAAASS